MVKLFSIRIKEETQIALFSIMVIYVIFSVVKISFFSEQSWIWHLETNLAALVFMLLFGYLIRLIDMLLDKHFPFERNIFVRIFLQFLFTLVVLLAIRLVISYFVIDKLPIKPTREIIAASIAINVFMVLSIILSIFGYHFFKRWKEEKIATAELEREKVQVQFDNLTNQLNPHFLFNSLTSLNSLIFENPQLASEFLQQLSKVYRYVLENKGRSLVRLQTEVDFIKRYVSLLTTRFGEGLVVNFTIDESDMGKSIAPVTLQVLIENAIKHNVTHKSSPLKIDIFSEEDCLVVSNNLQMKSQVDTSNGQGLDNLKGLYQYLSVNPMTIEKTENSFLVKVPLIN